MFSAVGIPGIHAGEDVKDDEMDALYAEYIMDHAGGERCIANGDDLLILMENGYLWDEFQEQYVRICASRR